MTIIAYRKGIMASDGRVTEDSTIFTEKFKKIFRLKDGSLLGSCGDADDRSLMDLLNKLKKDPTPKQLSALDIQFNCIVVRPDGRVLCMSCDRKAEKDHWDISIFDMKEEFIAVGSGSSFAVGAMDRGASAVQAVKTAIKYCNTCGGEVQSLNLVEKEKQ